VALAETANLIVNLQLKGGFSRALAKEARALGTFDARLDKTESRAFRAGQQIGTGIRRGAALAAGGLAILAGNVLVGLDSLVELEKQQAQTSAAIKSTGRVAGITADEVRNLAEKYEALNATIGDETIQETENLLLSFTNIRKKAFEPALEAILDINTRLGKGPEGLAGTARQVGKALNDPTKGLSALTRIGITFDKKTTARIKRLQKEGKLYEAQGVILKELNKRFGGAFAAEGQTTGGRVAKFKDAIEDLQRTLASGLLPVVSNIADALTELFQDKGVQEGVKRFGQDLAKFLSPQNIKSGIATIKDIALTIAPAFQAAASAIGLAVGALNKLPPDLRNLLIGAFAVNKLTGGLVGNIAGGLAGAIGGALKTIVAGHVTVIGKGGVGGAGAPTGGGGIAGKVGTVLGAAALAGLAAVIVNAVREGIAGDRTAQAQNIKAGLDQSIMSKTLPQLKTALAGVDQGIRDLQSNPLHALVQGEALTTLQGMRSDLTTRIEQVEAQSRKTKDDTVASVNKVKAAANETKRETTRGIAQARASAATTQQVTRSANLSAAQMQANATNAAAARIVGAIFAARPVVNVTQVTRNTTIQNRYGPGNGSSGRGSATGSDSNLP
jgi:hypothetical protein